MGDLIQFRDPELAARLRAYAVSPRVLATAIVDHVHGQSWRVTVTGGLEGYPSVTRAYQFRSKTEDAAAQEGLRVFVDEMGGA